MTITNEQFQIATEQQVSEFISAVTQRIVTALTSPQARVAVKVGLTAYDWFIQACTNSIAWGIQVKQWELDVRQWLRSKEGREFLVNIECLILMVGLLIAAAIDASVHGGKWLYQAIVSLKPSTPDWSRDFDLAALPESEDGETESLIQWCKDRWPELG